MLQELCTFGIPRRGRAELKRVREKDYVRIGKGVEVNKGRIDRISQNWQEVAKGSVGFSAVIKPRSSLV